VPFGAFRIAARSVRDPCPFWSSCVWSALRTLKRVWLRFGQAADNGRTIRAGALPPRLSPCAELSPNFRHLEEARVDNNRNGERKSRRTVTHGAPGAPPVLLISASPPPPPQFALYLLRARIAPLLLRRARRIGRIGAVNHSRSPRCRARLVSLKNHHRIKSTRRPSVVYKQPPRIPRIDSRAREDPPRPLAHLLFRDGEIDFGRAGSTLDNR